MKLKIKNENIELLFFKVFKNVFLRKLIYNFVNQYFIFNYFTSNIKGSTRFIDENNQKIKIKNKNLSIAPYKILIENQFYINLINFELTNKQGEFGSIWSNNKIKLNSNLLFQFQFQIQTPSFSESGSGSSSINLGGDGFALVFQEKSNSELIYDGGESIGYHNIKKGIVAIEFDTFENTGEPNDNHISIQSRNKYKVLKSYHEYSLASVTPTFNMKDGNLHYVEIWFNRKSSTFSITVDSIELLKNIRVKAFDNLKSTFIGFTSASNYNFSSHKIFNFKILKSK